MVCPRCQQLHWSSSLLPGKDGEEGCTPQSAGGDTTWTPTSMCDMPQSGGDSATWTPSAVCEMSSSPSLEPTQAVSGSVPGSHDVVRLRFGPPFNACWYRGRPFLAITACSKQCGRSTEASSKIPIWPPRQLRDVRASGLLHYRAMMSHSRAGCGSPAAGLYAFLPGNLQWTSSWACTQWCTQVILHNLDPGTQTSAFPSAHWRRCCRFELGLRTRRRGVTITD